ncbi:MAG: signal peptide peptidase SppA [Ignavibacteria bacterium]|nr:signal peptide peptidase SppA [Ignavibacteria bacterium]
MKKSTKWFLAILAFLFLFVAGFFAIVLVVTASLPVDSTETVTYGSGEKLGVIEVTGVIRSAKEVNRQVRKYADDSSIRAILIRVDSPGGAVVASQEIYEQIRRARDGGKPVVVSMGAMAASGGYYISCAATRIVANRGTLTGSIGVVAEFLQLEEALDKLGVGVKVIKTGRLKDAGTPVRDMTSEDERYFQSLMDEVHRQFAGVVELERSLEMKTVKLLADGRVFTGEEALRHGLVDTIGTFEDAVLIAAELGGIEGEPAQVKERKRRVWWEGLFGEAMQSVVDLKTEMLERPVLSYRFLGP